MEVKNLVFSYDKKKKNKIIDDVSFEIKEGKITTLLGANGCGKSTLFQLMTKNLIPDKGKVLLDGTSIRKMSQKEFAKKVAIVHQNNQAASDLTVEKLVAYGRTPHTSLFGANEEDEEIIEWAMEETDIIKYRERTVMSLSGGQRQRVWIAMALAQKTDTLFLDEPTTYLDIRYQIELLEMVKRLNETYGLTIVMVLHDINHAVYYSDYIIGMKDKKVIVEGNPVDIITTDIIEKLYGIQLEIMELNGRKTIMNVR